MLVLMPGILTKPNQAPPYVLAYGGMAAAVDLAVGAILWVTATLVLTAADRGRRRENAATG